MADDSLTSFVGDATMRVPQLSTLSETTWRVPRSAHETGHLTIEPPVDESDAVDVSADATLRVGQESAAPEADHEAPLGVLPAVTPRQLPLGVLAPGTVLCGDCTVRETVRPHETTRPGLYDCDAPEGRVMVKIAAAEFPPREDLWLRLPTLQHRALLRTYRVERERGFYAEVQEFCEGGTLENCLPHGDRAPLAWEVIERGIAASFLSGIAYLHANGIVHRDVKPKNLYLRKNGSKVGLVIADFDISSVIESDNTSRDTPRGAGTHYYMAPEAFPRFVDPCAGRAAAIVSPASDFYSFGVVLVELLLGTTALHSGRWSDVYDFYMGGGRLEIPAHIPPRARQLIQGLLIRNRRTRWGMAEVRRWIEKQTTDADNQKISDDAGFELVQRAARPYNVFASAPADIPSLARAMLDEPSLAEDELMSGDVMINWLGELDAKLAREIRRDRETWRRYPHVVYMSALMRLDPTLPFTLLPGLHIATWEEWEERVGGWVKAKKVDMGVVVSRHTLTRLETWLRLKSDPNIAAANGIAAVRSGWWDNRQSPILTPVDQRVVWEEIRWLRDPLLPYELAHNVWAHTPAEVARLCYGTQADWHNGVPSVYRCALEKWREGSLCAWLRQRVRDENGVVSPVVKQIDSLRGKNEFAPEATWETVLRMLDPTLPPVRLRLEAGSLRDGFVAEWGETACRNVNFEAMTPGLPFGVWRLQHAPTGLHISPLEINLRRGSLELRLNTLNGLEAGSAGNVRISLELGGTCSLEAPLTFTYHVRQPDSTRDHLVRNGVLVGASIAGGARLVAFLFTGSEWVAPPADTTDQTGATASPVTAPPAATTTAPATLPPTVSNNQPPWGYLGAGAAIILSAILAFYIWLAALRKHAQL